MKIELSQLIDTVFDASVARRVHFCTTVHPQDASKLLIVCELIIGLTQLEKALLKTKDLLKLRLPVGR